MRRITDDVVITLRRVNINRPRLLAASLMIAVVVSVAGGYVWSQTIAESDDDVNVVLEDSQDRTLEGGPAAIEPIPEGDVLPEATLVDGDGNDVSSRSHSVFTLHLTAVHKESNQKLKGMPHQVKCIFNSSSALQWC